MIQSFRTLMKTGKNSIRILNSKPANLTQKWSSIPKVNISTKSTLNLEKIESISLNYTSNYKFSSLPRHEKLGLPALSPTMTKGNLLKWNKQEGDLVKAGEVIADIETDKATVGFEVQEDCYLAKILVPEGTQDIDVGQTLAISVSKKDHIPQFANYSSAAATSAPAPSQPTPAASPAPAAAAAPVTSAPSQSYPKHEILSMPALSPTMEKGKILKWLQKVGDSIKTGESMAEVQTDKASLGFEYQDDDGFIANILQPAGNDLQVGTPVVIVVRDKANVAAFANYSVNTQSPSNQSTQQAPSTPSAPSQPAATSNSGTRVFASPLAKSVAGQNNVPLSSITGSGPNSRILKQDVDEFIAKGSASVQPTTTASSSTEKASTSEAAVKTPAAKPQSQPLVEENPFTDIPITNIRKVIANRLLQSKREVPHFYLTINIEMDNLIALRAEINKEAKTQISINDCIIKASALALRDVPEVNSQWHGEVIKQYKHSDVSVAVATETGLITPIIFNAGMKGLSEISDTMKSLAQQAKEGKLLPHEFQGGTFSISNLGMFDINNFSAIINPPQTAILAVGTTERIVKANPEGHKDPYRIVSNMNVTLSCDHRVVDGVVGAKWLARFQVYLEKPTMMLL